MKYALIKKGVCENVIEADAKFIEKIKPGWDEIISAENINAERGAAWDGKVFVRVESKSQPVPPKTEMQEIREKLDLLLSRTQ